MSADEGQRRRRVLVVDDDTGVRELMRILLEAADVEVRTARNGLEALTLVEKFAFDLLFVDYSMPGLDGLQLTAIIRRMHPRLPVVLVSGDLPPDAAIRGAGVTRAMPKPFLVTELGTCLDLIEPSRLTEEADGQQA
jgi:two-component system response regulator (stage 0 sporulation protein F)